MADEPESSEREEDSEIEVDVGSYESRDPIDVSKKKKKNPWSFQEVQVFQKGLWQTFVTLIVFQNKSILEKELFGHRWTKIADLLETRNAVQVKSYATRYLKNKAQEESQSLIMISALTSSKVHMEVEETNDEVDIEEISPSDRTEWLIEETVAENSTKQMYGKGQMNADLIPLKRKKEATLHKPCTKTTDDKKLTSDVLVDIQPQSSNPRTGKFHLVNGSILSPGIPIQDDTRSYAEKNSPVPASSKAAVCQTNAKETFSKPGKVIDEQESFSLNSASKSPQTSEESVGKPQVSSCSCSLEHEECISDCPALQLDSTICSIVPRKPIGNFNVNNLQYQKHTELQNDYVACSKSPHSLASESTRSPDRAVLSTSANVSLRKECMDENSAVESIPLQIRMQVTPKEIATSPGTDKGSGSKDSDIIPEDEATQICDALLENLSTAASNTEDKDRFCISIKLESLHHKSYVTRLPVETCESFHDCTKCQVAADTFDQINDVCKETEKPDVGKKLPRKRACKSEQSRISSLLVRRTTRQSRPITEIPEKLKISIKLDDLKQCSDEESIQKPVCLLETRTLSEGWMLQKEVSRNKRDQFCVENIKVDRSAFGVIKHKAIDENGKLSEKIEILASKNAPLTRDSRQDDIVTPANGASSESNYVEQELNHSFKMHSNYLCSENVVIGDDAADPSLNTASLNTTMPNFVNKEEQSINDIQQLVKAHCAPNDAQSEMEGNGIINAADDPADLIDPHCPSDGRKSPLFDGEPYVIDESDRESVVQHSNVQDARSDETGLDASEAGANGHCSDNECSKQFVEIDDHNKNDEYIIHSTNNCASATESMSTSFKCKDDNLSQIVVDSKCKLLSRSWDSCHAIFDLDENQKVISNNTKCTPDANNILVKKGQMLERIADKNANNIEITADENSSCDSPFEEVDHISVNSEGILDVLPNTGEEIDNGKKPDSTNELIEKSKFIVTEPCCDAVAIQDVDSFIEGERLTPRATNGDSTLCKKLVNTSSKLVNLAEFGVSNNLLKEEASMSSSDSLLHGSSFELTSTVTNKPTENLLLADSKLDDSLKYDDNCKTEKTSLTVQNPLIIKSSTLEENNELMIEKENVIYKEDDLEGDLVCSQDYETEEWRLGHETGPDEYRKSFLECADGPKLENDPFIAANENYFVESCEKKIASFMDSFSQSSNSSSSSPLSEDSCSFDMQSIPYECAVQLTELPLSGLTYSKGISDGDSSESCDSSSVDEDTNGDQASCTSDSDSESTSSSSNSSHSEAGKFDDESLTSGSNTDIEEEDNVEETLQKLEIDNFNQREIKALPFNKIQELTFREDSITPIERKECREFFMGKQPKTPSKYLEIRNFIIDEWKRIKPLYLTKNSIRSKVDPLDANAVGRVHVFLENHGVINVGCSTKNKWVERMEKRREKFFSFKRIGSFSAVEQTCDDGNGPNVISGKSSSIAEPRNESELDYDEITEEERHAHPQYFNGNKHKSPDKYLKIRNSIIDCWKDSKPAYLTKQAARMAMSWYCGDVNAVSRVHDYLEQMGAINFGCAHEPRRGRPSRARMNQERSKNNGIQTNKISKRVLKNASTISRGIKTQKYREKVDKEDRTNPIIRNVENSPMECADDLTQIKERTAQKNDNYISVPSTKKKRGRKPQNRNLSLTSSDQKNVLNDQDMTLFSKIEFEQGRDFINEREAGPPSDKSSTGDSGFDSISEISPCIDSESSSMSSKIVELREESNQAITKDCTEQICPTKERILNLKIITEEEKMGCSEFFVGRRVKPPEKYLKIRSSIIKSWECRKPHYLNKHNARCDMPWYTGDINSIGRVHAFLEKIGAINFGALRKPKRNGRKRKLNDSPKYNISSPDTEDASENSDKAMEDDVLSYDSLSQYEKDALKTSFFECHSESWTPNTYLKIRNVIMDMWSECKPKYLCKTEVYQRFVDDYDELNFVAEVHSFLETAGLINVGFSDNQQVKSGIWEVKRKFSLGLRPRKRWKMDINRDWVDKTDSEGFTIKHLSLEEERQESRQRPLVYASKIGKSLPESDPYKLVPCRTFPSDSATPFTVTICLKALLVMDFHSYLSSSEVIGLVGGKYYHASRRLEVMRVAPCSNVGTNLQCEMDPVSQAKASSDLAQHGLEVVGWYHSHPTFAPTPSLRDIDTQSTFQEWFSRAGAPFVGIIISPYNMSHIEVPHKSQITCLTISDQWDDSRSYRIPYMFKFKTEDLEKSDSFDDTIEQLKSTMRTVDGCKSYLCQGKLGNFPPGLLLSKSLEAKLNRKTNKKDEFLCQVKDLIGI